MENKPPKKTDASKPSKKKIEIAKTVAIPELQKKDFVPFASQTNKKNRDKTQMIPELQQGMTAEMEEIDKMRQTVVDRPSSKKNKILWFIWFVVIVVIGYVFVKNLR